MFRLPSNLWDNHALRHLALAAWGPVLVDCLSLILLVLTGVQLPLLTLVVKLAGPLLALRYFTLDADPAQQPLRDKAERLARWQVLAIVAAEALLLGLTVLHTLDLTGAWAAYVGLLAWVGEWAVHLALGLYGHRLLRWWAPKP